MDINSLTIAQAREIAAIVNGRRAVKARASAFVVGNSYMIRTVTHYWVGRVAKIVGTQIVLDGASWVSDTGRYGACVSADAIKECEFVGDGVIVNAGAIVDARPWASALPTVTQ